MGNPYRMLREDAGAKAELLLFLLADHSHPLLSPHPHPDPDLVGPLPSGSEVYEPVRMGQYPVRSANSEVEVVMARRHSERPLTDRGEHFVFVQARIPHGIITLGRFALDMEHPTRHEADDMRTPYHPAVVALDGFRRVVMAASDRKWRGHAPLAVLFEPEKLIIHRIVIQ